MKGKNKTMPRYLTVLGASVLLFGSLAWGADDQTDVDKRLDASAKVLTEIMGHPTRRSLTSDARCEMHRRDPIHGEDCSWFRRQPRKRRRYLPYRKRSMERSGPDNPHRRQLGIAAGRSGRRRGNGRDERPGMQHLLASKFKLGADASAAAGPVAVMPAPTQTGR